VFLHRIRRSSLQSSSRTDECLSGDMMRDALSHANRICIAATVEIASSRQIF